jgi:hypothetical protein
LPGRELSHGFAVQPGGTGSAPSGAIGKGVAMPTTQTKTQPAQGESPTSEMDRYNPWFFDNEALSHSELSTQAALNPGRIPLVNDELPWITLRLADLD